MLLLPALSLVRQATHPTPPAGLRARHPPVNQHSLHASPRAQGSRAVIVAACRGAPAAQAPRRLHLLKILDSVAKRDQLFLFCSRQERGGASGLRRGVAAPAGQTKVATEAGRRHSKPCRRVPACSRQQALGLTSLNVVMQRALSCLLLCSLSGREAGKRHGGSGGGQQRRQARAISSAPQTDPARPTWCAPRA